MTLTLAIVLGMFVVFFAAVALDQHRKYRMACALYVQAEGYLRYYRRLGYAPWAGPRTGGEWLRFIDENRPAHMTTAEVLEDLTKTCARRDAQRKAMS